MRTKQGVQTSDHRKNALRKVLVTLSTNNLAYRVKVEIKRKSTNVLSTSMNFQPACVATVHTFIVFKELQYEIVKMQTKIPVTFSIESKCDSEISVITSVRIAKLSNKFFMRITATLKINQ